MAHQLVRVLLQLANGTYEQGTRELGQLSAD